MKYFVMHHRGGLDDALKTFKEISFNRFISLMKYYKFYCYDDRIGCIRFIADDMQKQEYCWLLLQVKEVLK